MNQQFPQQAKTKQEIPANMPTLHAPPFTMGSFMPRMIARMLTGILIGCCAAATTPDVSFEFFAMDNGVGRGTWSPERQADTLKQLGYDGISYNYTNPADLHVWLQELGRQKLKLYGLYFPLRIDGDQPLPSGIAECVAKLKGTDAVLWITMPAPKSSGNHEATAVKRVQEFADLAARTGLRVAIYPHKGCYVASAEDAWRVVSAAGRPNVGLTVNVCHELAAGNGPRLNDIIRKVAPRLSMVTINGATDRPATGWSNYIKRLDEGDYDVFALLKTLKAVGYRGPVGLQCFLVKGEPEENLGKSMSTWRNYSSRLAPDKISR